MSVRKVAKIAEGQVLPAKRVGVIIKGTLLGTPNREPQDYSRNIMEYKDPGRCIPIIYLLYSSL